MRVVVCGRVLGRIDRVQAVFGNVRATLALGSQSRCFPGGRVAVKCLEPTTVSCPFPFEPVGHVSIVSQHSIFIFSFAQLHTPAGTHPVSTHTPHLTTCRVPKEAPLVSVPAFAEPRVSQSCDLQSAGMDRPDTRAARTMQRGSSRRSATPPSQAHSQPPHRRRVTTPFPNPPRSQVAEALSKRNDPHTLTALPDPAPTPQTPKNPQNPNTPNPETPKPGGRWLRR